MRAMRQQYLLEGVAKAWPVGKKSVASTGCQICDFVAFRRSQRPCVDCTRTGCDHFCEWCGKGFHAKCAKLRNEDVSNPNGFCCHKCESEQGEGHDTDEEETKGEENEEEDVGSLNQAVLVDNDEVLYNALITEVDTSGERIKIHFTRWSKSFDDWYAMDDEHINESLACDCCNQWFHIGCLPPIKSSGRWKDSTYVCPRCIDDARAFHNGNRSVLKAKAAYISTSNAIAKASKKVTSPKESETASVAVAKTKKASKAVVVIDEMMKTWRKRRMARKRRGGGRRVRIAKIPHKRKRKLSEAADSPSPSKAATAKIGASNKSAVGEAKLDKQEKKQTLKTESAADHSSRQSSSNTVMSLLNSPPTNEASAKGFKPTVTSLPMLNPAGNRNNTTASSSKPSMAIPANFQVYVKMEQKNGRKAEARETSRSGRGSNASANKRARMDASTCTSNTSAVSAGVSSHPAAPDTNQSPQTRERIQMNSFVDLHFSIRKEMYLRFCRLEEEGMLTRDSAHLLRSLIYPTSERFQDLKFVYLVNKDLPSVQLTKRLLEAVPYPPTVAKPIATTVPHAPPAAIRSPMGGKGLAGLPMSMGMFSAGLNRNTSPAGTSRIGMLPPPPGGSALLRPEPPRPDESSRLASGSASVSQPQPQPPRTTRGALTNLRNEAAHVDAVNTSKTTASSFTGPSIEKRHANWTAWAKYLDDYCHSNGVRIGIEFTDSIQKRNDEMRNSKRAKDGKFVRFLPQELDPIVAATCVISAKGTNTGRKFRRTACPFKLVAKSVYNDSKWEVEVTCPNAEHIHSETTREPAAPASETQPKPLIQSFPVEGLKGNPSSRQVLTDMAPRCKRMPENEAMCTRLLQRLNDLHDSVAPLDEKDPGSRYSLTLSYDSHEEGSGQLKDAQADQYAKLNELITSASDRMLINEFRGEHNLHVALMTLASGMKWKSQSSGMLDLKRKALARVTKILPSLSTVDWFIPIDELEYEEKIIGAGTFGEARRATWLHYGNTKGVVVKQLFKEIDSYSSDIFFKQLELWYKLEDKHILTLFGGSPSIDLNSTSATAQGLQVLHTAKLPHGALKCSNILVGDENTVKLTDFGFRSVRSLSASLSGNAEEAIATAVRWKPKEFLEENVNEELLYGADIYALGMCMIEALTQKDPFPKVDNRAVVGVIRKYERPDDILDAEWDFICRLCNPDESIRPKLSEVMKEISVFAEEEQRRQNPATA
ncbi:Protein kinase, ATP binding site [Phytophthora cactorum]|nr:Protein kinase, ATP binding site [Phytophthora cactorum]